MIKGVPTHRMRNDGRQQDVEPQWKPSSVPGSTATQPVTSPERWVRHSARAKGPNGMKLREGGQEIRPAFMFTAEIA